MHGAAGVGIAFGDSSEDTYAGKAVMDSFQIRSMIEYLTNQPAVRDAVEKALDKHRLEWKLATLGSGAEVWTNVKVSTLLLEALEDDDGGDDERANGRRTKAGGAAASASTSSVRSQFKVMLDVRHPDKRALRPWTDGHQRVAEFRNGQLVDLSIEG